MFTRKIYEYLLEWKRRDSGRTAALIEGPRRVGKSTVAKAFAQNEYRTHILVDFSAASQSVGELFEDVSDLDYLFYNCSCITEFSSISENQQLSLTRCSSAQRRGKQSNI